TAGVTRTVAPGTDFILDGGMRQKKQQAMFFSNFGTLFDSFVDTGLTTYSFTPRMVSSTNLWGTPSKMIAGMDIYEAVYGSDRPLFQGAPPIHRYDLSQVSGALYAMETVGVTPNTDVGFGGRVQRIALAPRDLPDPGAPGAFVATPPGPPFYGPETHHPSHSPVQDRINT